jgi:hypothetical protein
MGYSGCGTKIQFRLAQVRAAGAQEESQLLSQKNQYLRQRFPARQREAPAALQAVLQCIWPYLRNQKDQI